MRRLTHSAASQNEKVKRQNCRAGFKTSVLLLAAVITLGSVGTAEGKYSGGTGEPNNPYRIATANDLNNIGNHVEDFNKCFVMTADINLAAYTAFNVIGDYVEPFCGVFDGNSHTISHLTVPSGETVGLFGVVGDRWDGLQPEEVRDLVLYMPDVNGRDVGCLAGGFFGARISNCHVVEGRVSAQRKAGGLVAGCGDCGVYAIGGGALRVENSSFTGVITSEEGAGGLLGSRCYASIEDCWTSGQIRGVGTCGGIAGSLADSNLVDSWTACDVCGVMDNVGGLVGSCRSMDWPMSVVRCSASGNVYGGSRVGGLVGSVTEGSLYDCSATGEVVKGGDSVGGLVGNNEGGVTTCYASGAVTGSGDVGGLVGKNEGSVTNSHASGAVSGLDFVGGLVGFNFYGSANNCYATGAVGGNNVGGLVAWNYSGSVTGSFWDIESSGTSVSDGGTGETTAEMQTKSTFTDAGWDFNDVWKICEGTNYPRHIWSIPPADFVCPDGVNFIDYSFFADWWLTDNCPDANDCDGADFDFSGVVDEADVKIFSNYWLTALD